METVFENNKKRISAAVFVFMIIISLFFAVKTFNELKKSEYIGRNENVQSMISVAGKGEVFAMPDIAAFSFGVSETAKAVKDAQETVTNKMNGILSFLKETGINEKDTKTSYYNVSPKYEYREQVCYSYPCPSGKNTLVGYEVSHGVSVKIRDIQKVGDVLARVGALGATDISSTSFLVDKEEDLINNARIEAIKDAKEKADKLANELGVKIIRMTNYSESNNRPMPMYENMDMFYGKGGDSATPEIPSGENNIVMNVYITYEIR